MAVDYWRLQHWNWNVKIYNGKSESNGKSASNGKSESKSENKSESEKLIFKSMPGWLLTADASNTEIETWRKMCKGKS